MKKQRIISREYKLVLKIDKFKGDHNAVLNKATDFWNDLLQHTAPVIQKAEGNLDTVGSIRKISFYDTEDSMLENANYIFRERTNLADNSREVTLKFRHEDRYIAQDRDMQPRRVRKPRVKFEEDIKAPFQKLHSFSGTAPVRGKTAFRRIKDIADIYRGLTVTLNKEQSKLTIKPVNDFVAQETVITGARLCLSAKPEVFAECALIIWHNAAEPDTTPLIGEFSFRYASKKEKYPGSVSQIAYTIYKTLQENMKGWIDTKCNTKTRFVYDKG